MDVKEQYDILQATDFLLLSVKSRKNKMPTASIPDEFGNGEAKRLDVK